MSIIRLLASDSYLTVNKQIAKFFGLEAAAVLADLASAQSYWDNKKGTIGDWFYKTRDEIEESTTVKAKSQVRCLKELEKFGLVESKLMGVPAKMHYRIGELEGINLLNLLRQNGATGQAKMEELETPKRSNINKNKENNNKITKNKEGNICEKKISQTPVEEIEILDCSFEEEKEEGQKQTSLKATKKNITGAPGKKKGTDPLFKDFVEIHNQLCIEQTGSPAKWEGKAALNGKCINELINYFRKSVRAKEPLLTHDQETDKARQGFEYVRAKWGLLKKNDRYLASVDLAMINKNIENIFMFFRDYASGNVKVKGQYDSFYDELRKGLGL